MRKFVSWFNYITRKNKKRTKKNLFFLAKKQIENQNTDKLPISNVTFKIF